MICCISHTDTRLVWTQNPHSMHIFRAVACFLAGHKGLTRHHRGTLYPIICPLLPQRFTGTYMLCCKVLSRTSTLHRYCLLYMCCNVRTVTFGRRDRRGRQAICIFSPIFSPIRCTSASSLMVYRYGRSMYNTYRTRTNIHNAAFIE